MIATNLHPKVLNILTVIKLIIILSFLSKIKAKKFFYMRKFAYIWMLIFRTY